MKKRGVFHCVVLIASAMLFIIISLGQASVAQEDGAFICRCSLLDDNISKRRNVSNV